MSRRRKPAPRKRSTASPGDPVEARRRDALRAIAALKRALAGLQAAIEGLERKSR